MPVELPLGQGACGTRRLGGSYRDDGMMLVTAINQQARKRTGNGKSSESLIDFARWVAAQLGFDVSTDDGTVVLHLPEESRDRFDGQETVVLAEAAAAADGTTAAESRGATVESAVLEWLCDELRGKGPAASARPCGEPESVSALTPMLFAAYQIDGGQVHLAGCHLEDRPFLRYTIALASDAPFTAVRHVFVTDDLSCASDDEIAALGLGQVQPLRECPPRIDEGHLAEMLAAGRQLAARQQRSGDPAANVAVPLAAALVWTKYAAGQLQFTVGDQAVLLPFEGWARTLAAPPYVCPLTGIATFHLAATDDGRIVAAEAIAACAKSGRQVLASDLVRCHVTGASVLPEFTQVCPVAGEPALNDQFAECPTCRQRVSRSVLTSQGCQGCADLERAAADDPRLASILRAHPGLGRWKRWRLGETQTTYILRADGLLRQLLVVLDRGTMRVVHMARRGRLGGLWVPLAEDAWPHQTRLEGRGAPAR